MATNKILGSKNVLKKVFVFLVLSASFLSLNSQDAFAEVAGDQSKILVVEKLIENYIAFAHMGDASYLAPVGQRFEEKIEGQTIKRYIAVSQKKKEGYYCIDIYNNVNDQPIATLTAGLKIEKKKNGYLISPKKEKHIKINLL